MDEKTLLDILHIAEHLKDTTRHCYTSGGRHESVAEHSWRLCLFAWLLRDDFPQLDMDKVLHMCLIHDLGEAFTGDIPSFEKTAADSLNEDKTLFNWVSTLPEPYRTDMTALYKEMNALETGEAKLYKALDKLEAVIQHNESPLDTWLPLEYELQQTYGMDTAKGQPLMEELRAEVLNDTLKKIETEGKKYNK